jgi:hypothetical protein
MVYFILFNSIHDALKAERVLKEQSVEGEIVPVPRKLSSDCGVCIKSNADGRLLADLLSGLRGARCFVQDGTEYKPGSSRNQER